MNTHATKDAPFEGPSPTRDWISATQRENDLTGVVVVGMFLFCLGATMVAFWGMSHPILAKVIAYLGVK